MDCEDVLYVVACAVLEPFDYELVQLVHLAMEGLTAETCSFDGSRQTNYVQLLSLVDGDSLTQPAFGNLTAT